MSQNGSEKNEHPNTTKYLAYSDSEYIVISFFASNIALFSTILSRAAGYVTPKFVFPEQLVQVVEELANDGIHSGTKISPAIRVSIKTPCMRSKFFWR